MESHNPPLNMACLHLQFWTFGYSACLQSNPLSWVTWLLWVNLNNYSLYTFHYTYFLSRQVNSTKSLVMPQIIQRMSCLKSNSLVTLPSYKISHVWFSIMIISSLQNQVLFHVSCRWWGKHHGPPSTSLFLSTSTHHLGIFGLRNQFKYLEAYMPQW